MKINKNYSYLLRFLLIILKFNMFSFEVLLFGQCWNGGDTFPERNQNTLGFSLGKDVVWQPSELKVCFELHLIRWLGSTWSENLLVLVSFLLSLHSPSFFRKETYKISIFNSHMGRICGNLKIFHLINLNVYNSFASFPLNEKRWDNLSFGAMMIMMMTVCKMFCTL